MNGVIDTLKFTNSNGDKYNLYPRTLVEAITNKDGESLENLLKNSGEVIDENIATKEYVDDAYANSNLYTDQKIADLINGAPTTLDTLKEIADAMTENEEVVDALDEAIGSKANQTELDTHTGNDVIHVTSDERTAWNNKANATDLANYLPLSGGTVDGNILLMNKNSSNAKVLGLINSLRNIQFTVSDSGILGIWDDTNKKYLMQSTKDGSTTWDNALPKSGGTVNGTLTFKTYENGSSKIYKSHDNNQDNGIIIKDEAADGTSNLLILNAKYNKAVFRDKSGTDQAILHTGNVGSYALPISGGTLSGNVKFSSALPENTAPTVVATFGSNNSVNGFSFTSTTNLKAGYSSVTTPTTASLKNIYAGTSELTSGSSTLATGTIYVQYE